MSENYDQRNGIRRYQAVCIKQGLKACLLGMRLNTAYTPKNCLATASSFTGKKYGRGKVAMRIALKDMEQWLAESEARMEEVTSA